MANVFGTDNPETLDAADGVTSGADMIFGFNGDDIIFGLGGNDTIWAGTEPTSSTAAAATIWCATPTPPSA